MIKAIFGASCLLLAGTALAQNGIPQAVTDGMYITLAEIRANSVDTFDYFAGAEGGPVSKAEFSSAQVPDGIFPNKPEGPQLERLFGMLDANSDGQLTLREWKNGIDRDLAFADQNGDGRVTLKELSSARQNMGIGDALGMVF